MANWLEIDFYLPSELVEPVAELLRRLAPKGVAVEQDERAAELPDSSVRLRAWLPDDENLASRRQALEEGLWHLSRIQPIPDPDYRVIPEVVWSDSWRDLHHPLSIGQRLLVTPPWAQPPADSRIRITIEPGMAFGTGSHPTTRACLETLETLVQPGVLLADLGCGSGILSIAAAKLGARLALAYDTDPLAIDAARENAERNGVAGQLDIELGSLAQLRAHPALQQGLPQLLVANIHAGALTELLEEGLAEAVQPSGTVVLSGILEEQAEDLIRRAAGRGLHLQRELIGGDWRTLVLECKLPLEQGQL